MSPRRRRDVYQISIMKNKLAPFLGVSLFLIAYKTMKQYSFFFEVYTCTINNWKKLPNTVKSRIFDKILTYDN